MKETNRAEQRENKTNVEQKEREGNKDNERERERERQQIHRKDRRKCSQSEAINKQMRNTKRTDTRLRERPKRR